MEHHLKDQRAVAAYAELRAYDFDGRDAEDIGRWQARTRTEWVMELACANWNPGPSILYGDFVVTFATADGADVEEAIALVDGKPLGSRAQPDRAFKP